MSKALRHFAKRFMDISLLRQFTPGRFTLVSKQPFNLALHMHTVTFFLLLLLVWHAQLGVRSAKRRHQSPEWTILSHSYRLIQ